MDTENLKDFAEFFRLALLCDVTDLNEIIAWADDIIAGQPEPSRWATELATVAEVEQLPVLLKQVPGNVTGSAPGRMLLGRLARLHSDGHLEGALIARRILELSETGAGPFPPEVEVHACSLDKEFRLEAANERPQGSGDSRLREFLAPFSDDEPPPDYPRMFREMMEIIAEEDTIGPQIVAIRRALTKAMPGETFEFYVNGIELPGVFQITLVDSLFIDRGYADKKLHTRNIAHVAYMANPNNSVLTAIRVSYRRTPEGATTLANNPDTHWFTTEELQA